jgi:DNA-binding PadR family transcriptional regulator
MNDEITTITIHTDSTSDDQRRGRRRRGRRGGRMHDHHHHAQHHAEHDRGGRGGGRHRARRGAVRIAILTLLDERPMHGYELITELETRSDGRWRPSPGAIYPALDKMEVHGDVTSTEIDGKRQFSLTDRGRQMLAEIRDAQGDGAELPWNHADTGGRGELRRLMSELGGQVRQIARFGSSEQREEATAVLQDTVRRLYEVLARPHASSDTDPGTD